MDQVPSQQFGFSRADTSDAARLNRICELLAKAVIMEKARQALIRSESKHPETPSFRVPKSNTARIADYLSLVGAASPDTIRSTLGLSRWCAHRALATLVEAGAITRVGQTRALVYRPAQRLAA